MTRTFRRDLPKRPDLSSLTSEQRMLLETGTSFFDCGVRTVEDFRVLWERYRDDLRSEWISAQPGSRPFAEWLLELIPQFGERRTIQKYWQALEPRREKWLTLGILHTALIPPVQESEAEYLDRHGLLSDQERAVLGAIVPAEEQFRREYPEWHSRIQ